MWIFPLITQLCLLIARLQHRVPLDGSDSEWLTNPIIPVPLIFYESESSHIWTLTLLGKIWSDTGPKKNLVRTTRAFPFRITCTFPSLRNEERPNKTPFVGFPPFFPSPFFLRPLRLWNNENDNSSVSEDSSNDASSPL